ncbi:MAG: hypothetical protein AB8C46_07950 [Burkholderiaceae bacterium]
MNDQNVRSTLLPPATEQLVAFSFGESEVTTADPHLPRTVDPEDEVMKGIGQPNRRQPEPIINAAPTTTPRAQPEVTPAPTPTESVDTSTDLGGIESTGGFRTEYVGIQDPNNPDQFLGQVEVQFNPNTGKFTAYGLGGSPVELPEGVTREQVASGQLFAGLALIPLSGAGTDGGQAHIDAMTAVVAQAEAGNLDAETVNRITSYLGGQLAIASTENGWTDTNIQAFIALGESFAALTGSETTGNVPDPTQTVDTSPNDTEPDGSPDPVETEQPLEPTPTLGDPYSNIA